MANGSSDSSVARPSQPLWYTGLHTLGTSLIVTPLMIAGSIIIARSLGPAGKGSYDLLIATATLLGLVLDFGLPAGVVYVVARGKTAPGSLALRLILIAPAQALLAAGILYFLQPTSCAAAFLPPRMGSQAIIVIAVSLLFIELSTYWRSILVGLQEIIKANRLELIRRVLFIFLLTATMGILFLCRHRASAIIFAWVHATSLILTSLILLYCLRSFLYRGATDLRELAAFAFPSYLANFSQFLNYRMDVFMVSFFIGVEGVGLYTIAVNLAQLIWLISRSAAMVLLPKIAASQEAVSENTLSTARITRLTFWISFVLALFLALFAHMAIPIVYGEAFRRSIAPFLWLLPGIVAFSTVNVLVSYIAGIGKPRLNFLISLGGLFFTIVLDLALIPRFNIVGAAIASTVSYSISAALTIWFFRKLSGRNLADILLFTSEDIRLAVSLSRTLYHRLRFKKVEK